MLCKINSYRYLKQSEIFGSGLTATFTLTSETEAERSSDFHFGFDYTIIQDIDDGENVRFVVYVLKNVSFITA